MYMHGKGRRGGGGGEQRWRRGGGGGASRTGGLFLPLSLLSHGKILGCSCIVLVPLNLRLQLHRTGPLAAWTRGSNNVDPSITSSSYTTTGRSAGKLRVIDARYDSDSTRIPYTPSMEAARPLEYRY